MKMKVSVVILSYNQSKYIKQALNSVVSQQTNFPFEVIVADDCSTDDTLSVCGDFETKYPFVRVEQSDKNLGYSKNWERALSLGSGEYLAVFEGDDYWTDNLKLQKQSDYLDANPDCGMCYTECDIFNEDTKALQSNIFSNGECVFNCDNPILSKGYPGNVSWMIRKKTLLSMDISIPNDHPDVPWLLLYEFCLHINIGFIPDNTGVWRLHKGSLSNDAENELRMYKYQKDTFLWRKKYINAFPDAEKNAVEIYTRALMYLWTYANKIDDKIIVDDIQDFFETRVNMKSLGNFLINNDQRIHSLKADIVGLQKSLRYRIGTILLLPILLVKKLFKK